MSLRLLEKLDFLFIRYDMSNSSSAIIGHSGFVGGNIAKQHDFELRFNSSNITELKGLSLDRLVVAAPSAVKWKANQEPEADMKMIMALMKILETVSAKQVIHISTVDVYKNPKGVDESTIVQPAESQPYGKHRFLFEEFTRKHFPNHLIVRLPGLFGEGLKKNFIYDMLHSNCLDLIHKDSIFQFYSLDNIWNDIQIAIDNKISLINLATEPTSVSEIAAVCFHKRFTNVTENPPITYDMKSIHAPLYDGKDGYLYSKQAVLAQISDFIKSHETV